MSNQLHQQEDRVTEIRIGTELVEITARTANRTVSGWSVAAFTSCCAVRSTKCHDETSLKLFVNAVIAACSIDGRIDPTEADLLTKEIQNLIQ